MLKTMQRALRRDAAEKLGWQGRDPIKLFFCKEDREAIASIGKLKGDMRDSEGCLGGVIKKIVQERIQAEGKK